MTKRIEYQKGDKIGNSNFVYLEEAEPYISPQGRKDRRALCICPICHKEKIVNIAPIRAGRVTSCGCLQAPWNRDSKDLTNQKFGQLIAKYSKHVRTNSGRSKILWYCECECGGSTWTTVDSLISGHTKSCGCMQSIKSKETHTKDITGMRSGKLVAIKRLNKQDKAGNYYWLCQCDCGRTKEVKTTNIITQSIISCGCIISYGETLIKDILTELSISFKEQYMFQNCINPKTNTKLKFDFYLPDYNCCIEFDGKQHFIEHATWAEKDSLKTIQYRDNLKNQYCKNNNIYLIRIPYWELSKLNKEYIINLLSKGGV